MILTNKRIKKVKKNINAVENHEKHNTHTTHNHPLALQFLNKKKYINIKFYHHPIHFVFMEKLYN